MSRAIRIDGTLTSATKRQMELSAKVINLQNKLIQAEQRVKELEDMNLRAAIDKGEAIERADKARNDALEEVAKVVESFRMQTHYTIDPATGQQKIPQAEPIVLYLAQAICGLKGGIE